MAIINFDDDTNNFKIIVKKNAMIISLSLAIGAITLISSYIF